VDYQKKTWEVIANYKYTDVMDGFLAQFYNRNLQVRHHGGETYLASEGWPVVMKVDETNRRLVPVTVFRAIFNPWKPAAGWPTFVEEVRKYFNKGPDDAFWMSWTDFSGNGEPSVDEVENLTTLPVHWIVGFPEKDFTYLIGGGDGEGDTLQSGVWELPVKKWLHGKVPVYDYENMKQIVPGDHRFGRGQVAMCRDAQKNTYVGNASASGAPTES
jgi:hypothetical protein